MNLYPVTYILLCNLCIILTCVTQVVLVPVSVLCGQLMSCFQSRTPEDVGKIGSGLSPEVTFHTWTMQRKILCSGAIQYRNIWSVQVRGGASGRGRTYCINSTVCLFTSPALPPITKSSLDIFACTFYVFGTAFSSWDICVPFLGICLEKS